MFALRKSEDRGQARFGWLDSRHSFSFGSYYDPAHMGFGPLRVINQDVVNPGAGFGAHGHRDMEILSYVLSGALEHRDNMGTGSVIRPGDVQRMSAGTGVMHSEYNHSQTEPVEFLQIWIEPEARGLKPGYEQKHFAPADRRGRLALLASRDGRDGSLTMHQDAALYGGFFDGAEAAEYALTPGRGAWVHVVRGALDVAGQRLHAGDGLAVTDQPVLSLSGGTDAEILLFDIPMNGAKA